MFAVRHHVKLDKNTSAGDALRLVKEALSRVSAPLPHVTLEAWDPDAGTGVARAVKALPALAALRQGEHLGNAGPSWSRSGPGTGLQPIAHGPWAGQPIDAAVLQELLDGVPKRFPIFRVCAVLGPVPALDLTGVAGIPAGSEPGRPGTVLGPVIGLSSAWGTPRRVVHLWVTVVVAEPPAGKRPFAAAPATEALLAAFGKPVSVTVEEIIPPEEAQRRARLTDEAKALVQAWATAFDPTTLPHALQRNPSYQPQEGSLVEPVKRVLGRLGYKQAKGARTPGVAVWVKRAPGHQALMIVTDRTPIAGEFRAELSVQVPGAHATWRAPVSRVPAAAEVPDQAACDAAAENLDVLVRRWEEGLVPTLLAHLGPGAPWHSPG